MKRDLFMKIMAAVCVLLALGYMILGKYGHETLHQALLYTSAAILFQLQRLIDRAEK